MVPAPSVGDLGALPREFAGGSAALGWALVALAVYATVRARGWRVRFVVAWLVVPVLLAFLVSLVEPMRSSDAKPAIRRRLAASLAAAGYVRVPLPVSFRRVDVTLYRH